jgi:D-serine dehydratase
MNDPEIPYRIEEKIDRMLQTLTRIANALDRAIPQPPDRTGVIPSDLKDLTVVTPALRRQWEQDERAQHNGQPDPSTALPRPPR